MGPVYAKPKIELYGVPNCEECVRAKKVLSRKGIPYQSFDLRKPHIEKKYVSRFGRGKIPVIVVGDKVLRGEKINSAVQIYRSKFGSLQLDRKSSGSQEEVTCTNNQNFDEFIKRELRRPVSQSLTIDAALERAAHLCYGAAGVAKCGGKTLYFTDVKNSSGKGQYQSTADGKWLSLPMDCVVTRFEA